MNEDWVNDWHLAVTTAALRSDRPTSCTVAGQAVAVLIVDEDVYVVRDRCPVCAAALSGGRIEGRVLLCPGHDGGFALPDEPAPDEREPGMPEFLPAVVVDEEVFVHLSDLDAPAPP